MKKKLWVLLAVISLLIAACGSSDDGGETTAGSTETTATETTEGSTETTEGSTETTEGEAMEAPDAIYIGAVVPQTGPFAGGGAQVARGYTYAVDAINAAGGVYVEEYDKKLPLELLLRDDESDPNKTTAIMEDLAGERVVAYLGGFASPLHAAGAAVGEKNQIPYLGVATALQALHEQGYTYYFSPFPKSPDIAVSVFEMLNTLVAEGERPTRVGIFQEATDWGEELGALWEEEAAKAGYEVVLRETYAPGTEDFTDMILKAQAADVEALLSLPTPPDGFNIYKQMGELGWKPPFSLVVRAADVPTWNDLGDVGDGVLLSAGWHPDLGYEGIDAINQRHIDEEGRPADPVVGGSYALVQILADAIERAGSLDTAAIRDAIAATDRDTVVGHVTFREDGTAPIENPLMQRQGDSVVLIWPQVEGTGELVYPAN
jgi:branched-chain amino acid transport system substrate-binding protein